MNPVARIRPYAVALHEIAAEDLLGLNDPRLGALLRANAASAEAEIERIMVELAQPVIQGILARSKRPRGTLSFEDAEDVGGIVNVRLVAKLRAVRESADEAVRDLDGYVATLTYNALNDHLRRSFPARTRLKNRLRYALRNDPRLSLWNVDGVLVAGLAAWDESRVFASAVSVETTRAMLDGTRAGHALVAILERIGGPVDLDALVTFTAELWQVTDAVSARLEPVMPSATELAVIEAREALRTLWREIMLLRPMQRKALLLNLRSSDGLEVTSLLVLTGVAPFDDLARALEMAPYALAAIWNELPLDDLSVAAILGVSRQQVINLRKCARERLARRMRK